jgi:hypothetical protein
VGSFHLLACAGGWEALLEARRARIRGFTEGRGYDLRRQLHAEQRPQAIADYDENRCNAVLDALKSTVQVPTLGLNTLVTTRPFQRPDWAPALAALQLFARSAGGRSLSNCRIERAKRPAKESSAKKARKRMINELFATVSNQASSPSGGTGAGREQSRARSG